MHQIDGPAGDRPARLALLLVRNQVFGFVEMRGRILCVRFGSLAATLVDRYPSVQLFALVLRLLWADEGRNETG